MRLWNSLSLFVLMSSTVTWQVRLAWVRGAGGSVLVSSGGGLEEQMCFFVAYECVHLPCGQIFVGSVRLLGA